jgi:DNA-binding NarL/FixJ family response regulator
MAVRILIVDDHPLVRSGLRSLLAATDDLEVIGEAASGEEAVAMAASLRPDVIVMDVRMPGLNGIDATRLIVDRDANARVLVVTLFEDDETVFSALRVGARGYVIKEASEVEVLRAVRAVADGDAIFSPSVARRLIDFFNAPLPPPRAEPFPDLTGRERELLAEIAQGRNNSDIARSLGISLKTVRNYISSILNKLQVTDRAQAIVRAREAGIGVKAPRPTEPRLG